METKKTISTELIEALNQMVKGEEKGFNIVYKETYNYVWNRCRMIMGNDDDAMELLQEVYIAFYNSIEKMENANNVFGWLKTACYYQHTMLSRKKKEVLLSEDGEGLFDIQETVDSSVLPGVELEQKETIDIIKGVIEELSEEQRAVITAYYYDEMSVKEIAESLNVSDGTVKSRLNYARKHIKEAIEEKETKLGIKLHSTSVPALIFAIRSMLQGYTVSGTVMESSYAVIGSSLGFVTEIANTASQVSGVSSAVTSATEMAVEVAGKEAGKNILKGMIGKTAAIKIAASVVVVISLIVGGVYIVSQQKEEDSNPETVIVADEQSDTSIQVDGVGEDALELTDNDEKQEGENTWNEEEWIQKYQPLLEEYKREQLGQLHLEHDDRWVSSSGYTFQNEIVDYSLYDINKDNIPELLLGYEEGSSIFYDMPYEGLYTVYGVFTWNEEKLLQLLGTNEDEKVIGHMMGKVYFCEDNCIIWSSAEQDEEDVYGYKLVWKSKQFEVGSYDFFPTGDAELTIKAVLGPDSNTDWKDTMDGYFAQHKLVKFEWRSLESDLHTIDDEGNVIQYSESGDIEWTTNVYEIVCDINKGLFKHYISLEDFPSCVYNCKIYQEECVRVRVLYSGYGDDWVAWHNIYLDTETGELIRQEYDMVQQNY